jgi:glycosyltransferase involved in cell wall biosynthesis
VPGRTVTGRPLRVGLNLLFLGARAGGVGRYARELPGALLAAEPETEIHVFVARDAPADLRAEPWAGSVHFTTLPLPVASRALQAGQYLALPALAASRRLDVLHNPANAGPVITPGVASVVSLMDLIWLHRPAEWEPDPRAQRALRRLVVHGLRHADAVFAISRAVADDVVRSFGVPDRRITVTPLGVRPPEVTAVPEQALREQLGLGRARVLLCVAQKRPYKNLEHLIRALPALDPDVMVVLVGSSTPHETQLRRLAGELGVAGRVRLADWVSEAELAGLYALSEAFVLPSLIEGFGLPVLEAMVHGLAVACSDVPALVEVAGDAALLFDPRDQEAIDRGLRRLLGDAELRRDLVARGRERAARFSWARTGEASLRGYREAIAGRSRAVASPLP